MRQRTGNIHCNALQERKEFPNKQSKIKRGGTPGPRGEKRGRISGRRDVGGERGGADSHHGTRPQCVCLALPQQSSHPKDTASRKLFSDYRNRHTEKDNNLQNMVEELHFGLHESESHYATKKIPNGLLLKITFPACAAVDMSQARLREEWVIAVQGSADVVTRPMGPLLLGCLLQPRGHPESPHHHSLLIQTMPS